MDKKDEFKKLMDDILKEILNEVEQTSESKMDFALITKTILDILLNLNDQIAEQKKYISKLEEQLRKSEHDFKFFIQELKKDGYINIKERRKLLRRNSLTNEALINLLGKKKVIGKTELREEIRRLNEEQSRIE